MDSPRLTGRPREERADRAILAATLELMAEHGVHDLRMADVAERAGAGKATIYRRHRSKDELITAAVAALVSEISVPNTGSTRSDLFALMRNAVEVYGSVQAGVMPSLVEAMSRNPDLARFVREGFLARRRAALRAVLERGIERGDLPTDLDRELALDILGGPLFYGLLITGGPIDEQLAEGIVELILRGFAEINHAARTSMERDPTADTQRTGRSETGRHQMKMTVFGATGGIGGHVVRQALDAGHKATAVVRDP